MFLTLVAVIFVFIPTDANSSALQKGVSTGHLMKGTAMQKLEYKAIYIFGSATRTTRILNDYGHDGWELIGTWFCWFYFSRPLV
jgi:hypothetical protein